MDDVLRDQIIEAIVDFPPEMAGDIPAVMADLQARFPTVSEDDIFGCFEEAIAKLRKSAAEHFAEAEALEKIASLGDGMPEGMSIGECARIKAERGDPLALAFLKWEADQAGGVQ